MVRTTRAAAAAAASESDVQPPATSFTTIAKWALETLLDSSVPQVVVDRYEASTPVPGKEDAWSVVPRTSMNKLRGLLRDLDKYAKNGELDISVVRVFSMHVYTYTHTHMCAHLYTLLLRLTRRDGDRQKL